MLANDQVNWQPISQNQMPLIASMIDTALDDTGSMQTRGVHCTIAAVASSPFAGWKPEYRNPK